MDTFASQDTEYDMCPSGFLCKCAAFLNDINRKNAEKSKNKPANFAVLTSLRAGGALLWRTCSRPALLSHSASRRFPLRQCCLGAAVRAASPQTWRAVRRAAAAAAHLPPPSSGGCWMYHAVSGALGGSVPPPPPPHCLLQALRGRPTR